MDKKEETIEMLRNTLAQFLKPLKNIPFFVAIQSISDYKVLAFNKNSAKDKELLTKLKRAMEIAMKNAYKKGIVSKRVNEVGNYIESFVKESLESIGIKANIPTNSLGKKQATGYPDICLEVEGEIIYLECKTYNKNNINTTFRSFYFQPSKNPKITCDAKHLMVAFEITQEKRDKEIRFVPVHWKLYDLYEIKVQVKHEFNASNKDIYKDEYLLAEGIIS